MTLLTNPDGYSTVFPGGQHANFPRPLPTQYHEFFEEFAALPVLAANGGRWTHTNTNGTLAVTSPTSLTQTLGGASGDLSQLYFTTATHTLVAGKKAFFRAKVKVAQTGGTIGLENLFFGLAAAETGTNFLLADGSALASTNCIGFFSNVTTAAIDLVARAASVQTLVGATTTYVSGTSMELGFDFDGQTATFYRDTYVLGSIKTNIPTAALSPMLFIKEGENHARVLTTDYLWLAIER